MGRTMSAGAHRSRSNRNISLRHCGMAMNVQVTIKRTSAIATGPFTIAAAPVHAAATLHQKRLWR